MNRLVCHFLLLFGALPVFAKPVEARLKAFYKSLVDGCEKTAPAEPPEFSRAEQVQLCAVKKIGKTFSENPKFLCPEDDGVHCYTALVDQLSVEAPLPPQIQLVLLESGVQVLTDLVNQLKPTMDGKELEAKGIQWLLEILVSNGEAFVRSPACRSGNTSLCPSRREGIAAIVIRGKELFPPTQDKQRDALIQKDPHFESTKARFEVLKGLHHYEEGVARFDAGDYSGAIEQYTQAAKFNPGSFHIFYSRGSAKFELKNYRGALADYATAIKLNPKSSRCHFFSGIANLKVGRTAQAKRDLARSQELSPKVYEQLKQRYP